MKRLIAIGEFISLVAVALLMAWLSSSALKYALEPHEIRNYVEGKPLFDKPATASYARLVAQEMQEKLDREGILSREAARHGAVANFTMRLGAFLHDPLNVVLIALYGLGIKALYRRFKAKASYTFK